MDGVWPVTYMYRFGIHSDAVWKNTARGIAVLLRSRVCVFACGDDAMCACLAPGPGEFIRISHRFLCLWFFLLKIVSRVSDPLSRRD